jgi:hypothetical protein
MSQVLLLRYRVDKNYKTAATFQCFTSMWNAFVYYEVSVKNLIEDQAS